MKATDRPTALKALRRHVRHLALRHDEADARDALTELFHIIAKDSGSLGNEVRMALVNFRNEQWAAGAKTIRGDFFITPTEN